MIDRMPIRQQPNIQSTVEQHYHKPFSSTDYSHIKVGTKTLEDAILSLGDLKKVGNQFADKNFVLQALYNSDFVTLREISDFFYKTSGIYQRLCRYMAYLYRYDWFLTPYVQESELSPEKIKSSFYKVLNYLDNFEIKKFFGEVALKVIRYGCYYGYCIPQADRMLIQELPVNYCRSRFFVGGVPAIEFQMKFFDDTFRDTTQRAKMLSLFPKDFQRGYRLYKENKLPAQFMGDQTGWYMLEPGSAIKFNINGEDFPMFASVIPDIIDLDTAKDLDRKKMEQKLLKIVVQKMPLDKNNEPIFDEDEAAVLHNNAVLMLSRAIGVDVLTTFADVAVEDMADTSNTTATDDLERVERQVYNEAGVSQKQFNTDGNLALEKSILNDEASLYNLIVQFERFLNDLVKPFNKSPKKINFKVQLLTTTIYNYKEMAKLYKEQTQLGYSKMLPQIALGQSQSSILANAYFENDILDLVNVFIPPLMSSTMNADVLNRNKNAGTGTNPTQPAAGEVGRKEKSDDEKSEKTIQNKESMN